LQKKKQTRDKRVDNFLGLNLYPKYSKKKPNGYLQNWQIEILKNAWINNIGYLYHQLKIDVEYDFDKTLSLEEWLNQWNEYYNLHSHLMPDFKNRDMSRLVDKWNKTQKNKVEDIEEKPLKMDIFDKDNSIIDLG
jgi:hypothetical protein